MTNLSMPLLLAWDIAANEAAHARSKLIEPEHLFIGLCKLEDFASTAALIDLGYEASEAEEMRPEIGGLVALYYQFGLSPSALRREVRQRKTTGVLSLLNGWTTGILRSPQPETGANVIHRSQASRVVFTRADEFATVSGAITTNVFHLLAALLDQSNNSFIVWLTRQVNVEQLKAAALKAEQDRQSR